MLNEVALIVLGCGLVVNSEPFFSVYETPQSIEFHGYPAETHRVTTSDGYILEMHRIPHGKDQEYTKDRPVVFLMHGLLVASNSYVYLGTEFGPAYNFGDSGFDVWMGNARGTKSSRHHVSIDPDHSRQRREFFNFSWEEIAIYDLPAMIDYRTNKEKLYYVGHSQGGTVFLVLNSMRPEYQEKIQSAHLWAGVGYMNNFPQAQLALMARFTDTIYSEYSINIKEGSINDQPGAASKQVAHFGQNVRDKTFARWSYGTIQNLIIYGSRNAPEYDLSLIKVNVTMHYTVNDILLAEKDVLAMAAVMPNTKARKIARESFLHSDFIFATDVKELVTDYIIKSWRTESGLWIDIESYKLLLSSILPCIGIDEDT